MVATEQRRRLFVGIPVPEPLFGIVRGAQQGLLDLPGFKPTRADQLHVTLCFLGEVESAALSGALRVVSELPCTMGGVVGLGGLVCLPSPKRTRVVALGIDDREGVTTRLFEAVAGGLEKEAGYHREKRPFRPHLTIGRFKQPVSLGPQADSATVPFDVGSVCLYESTLSRAGARYTVLGSAKFDIAK
jgi:2'-5' RNA ligase